MQCHFWSRSQTELCGQTISMKRVYNQVVMHVKVLCVECRFYSFTDAQMHAVKERERVLVFKFQVSMQKRCGF